MTLTPDEQKSLEYTQREKEREAFQRTMQAKLKAPSGPAQQVRDNTRPLLGRRNS